MPTQAQPTDYAAMDEAALESALRAAQVDRDAARDRAAEVTRHLDALRARKSLEARLGGLSPAEREILARDGVARVAPLDAVGRPGEVGDRPA
jgi:hypothetical protein